MFSFYSLFSVTLVQFSDCCNTSWTKCKGVNVPPSTCLSSCCLCSHSIDIWNYILRLEKGLYRLQMVQIDFFYLLPWGTFGDVFHCPTFKSWIIGKFISERTSWINLVVPKLYCFSTQVLPSWHWRVGVGMCQCSVTSIVSLHLWFLIELWNGLTWKGP